jgi:hypothetical protein
MSGATEHDAGVASGLVNITVQALATSHTRGLRAAGDPSAALTGGYHLAATTGAGLGSGRDQRHRHHQTGPGRRGRTGLRLRLFGRWLRGQNNHLLDGPSVRYPEIIFIR